MTDRELENLELDLLFEALNRRYGYDFSQYSRDSACRRVRRRVIDEGLGSISQLQDRVLHNEDAAEALLRQLSINVTEMFRDPAFYEAFRERAVPFLRDQEHFKIWHAGCATGQEPYSMAILLKEEGLYDRARLYATDFNNVALDKAKTAIYPLNQMQTYTANYLKAGGKASLSDYYHAKYDGAVLDAALKKNIVFSNHNLVADDGFGEVQVIVCRNVIIYFDHELQERVIQLFTDNLSDGGILCLGSHESLRLFKQNRYYLPLDEKQRIFKKVS